MLHKECKDCGECNLYKSSSMLSPNIIEYIKSEIERRNIIFNIQNNEVKILFDKQYKD